MDNLSEDLSMRDKFAIEILQSFLFRDLMLLENFMISAISENEYLNEDLIGMEKLIKAAYKVADMMRKVRLVTFE